MTIVGIDKECPFYVPPVCFFHECTPPTRTAQQKRVNHATGRFFKGKEDQATVDTWDSILMSHRPTEPVTGAVSIVIDITWPWRKKDATISRTKRFIPCTSKPDADNVAKTILDRLVTWRFIENDQSVCDLRVRKFFGARPGIKIEIDTVEA